MDSLTHGLFGLAVAALRRPDGAGEGGGLGATDRAVVLACVLAAELPDLDYLWPADDPVMVTLRAHRGLSHALIAAPAIALVAAALARLAFRSARFAPVYAQAVLAVIFAHLLPDLWTGWGTRLLLPFSDARLTLDWTSVIDPMVTLPLLAGAVWVWRARRRSFWRPIRIGLAVTAAYLGLRIGAQQVLSAKVARAYGTPAGQVFPAPLGLLRWRYVVPLPGAHAAGVVGLGGPPEEQSRTAAGAGASSELRDVGVAREVLAWARWPAIETVREPDGSRTVSIGDLRYRLDGKPTLRFVLDVDPAGAVTAARLDRGGSFRELLARWRAGS